MNGHPETSPIAPFGLQAYNSAGVFAAIGALVALLARRRTGRAAAWSTFRSPRRPQARSSTSADSSGRPATSSAAAARCTGAATFRIGPAADGWVLHSTIGDWTTLAGWVAMDGEAWDLFDERWEEPQNRKGSTAGTSSTASTSGRSSIPSRS